MLPTVSIVSLIQTTVLNLTNPILAYFNNCIIVES